jgi:peptidoglycan/xylan/chitin deacetylase (PgdA/CDA1 family)
MRVNKYKILYIVLKSFGFFFLFKKVVKYRPIVICYHRISQDKLEEHLSWFKKEYSVFRLNYLLDKYFSSECKEDCTYNCLAITMDDCYESDFKNMLNATVHEQLNCTYFLPVTYAQSNKSFWSLRLIQSFNNIVSPLSIAMLNGERIEILNELQKQEFVKGFIIKLQNNNLQTDEVENVVTDFLRINNISDRAEKIINMNEVKESRDNELVCFQSHTLTHPKLYLCSDEELKIEFNDSKQALSQFSFSYSQDVICYPYGSLAHIGNSYKLAANTYKFGVTLMPGVINSETNKLLIPRIGIYERDTIYSIELKFLKAQFLNTLKVLGL